MKNTGSNPFGSLIRAFGQGYMGLDDLLFGGYLPGGAMTDNQVRSTKEKKAGGLFEDKPVAGRDDVPSKMPLDMEPEQVEQPIFAPTRPTDPQVIMEDAAIVPRPNPRRVGLEPDSALAAGAGMAGGPQPPLQAPPIDPSLQGNPNPFPSPQPPQSTQPAPPAQPVLAPQMTPPISPEMPMSMPPGAQPPSMGAQPGPQLSQEEMAMVMRMRAQGMR